MSEHPSEHIANWENENYQAPSERAWLSWIDQVERLFGRDVDGDQDTDGYSMDKFHDLWKLGSTPQQAIAQIAK